LRTGQSQDLYAQCDFVKQGRRIDNVAIKAYQTDPEKPIATARAHFLL
jgi:acyl-coenzyme A thioesterase PaaI-like protein